MKATEEEYKQAWLLYQKENPKKQITTVTTVTLENGKKVNLGEYIHMIRSIHDAIEQGRSYRTRIPFTEEQLEWWTSHGLTFELPIRESNYRKAFLLWKKEHPDEALPIATKVTLADGTVVRLGARAYKMKKIYEAMQDENSNSNYQLLTQEQIKWWTEQGFDFGLRATFTEEEYREALLLWKESHPGKETVFIDVTVPIQNGKLVPLGKRISTMRSILSAMKENKQYGGCKDLTEEQIAWWTAQGINLEKREPCTEEEYREAFLIWRKENPKKNTISLDTTVILPNQKTIRLGVRFYRLRKIYQAMQEDETFEAKSITREQLNWWIAQGLTFKEIVSITEEEYQEAYLLWKKESKEIPLLPNSYVVKIENGKEIDIGKRVFTMRKIYQAEKDATLYQFYNYLSKEQIEWWTREGVDFNLIEEISVKEFLCRTAYLQWKKQNHELETVDSDTVIELKQGEVIELGKQISTLKKIYEAMLEGKHYKRCHDLTEEQIAWWTSHGIDFPSSKNKKSKNLSLKKRESKDTKKLPTTFSKEPPKRKKLNAEMLQQLYLQWKEEHPEAESIPYAATIENEDGKVVAIGSKVAIVRYIYQAMKQGKHYQSYKDLTEEQIAWWTSHGLDLEAHKKEKAAKKDPSKKTTPIRKKDQPKAIQQAFLLWKQNHEEEGSVPYDTVVKLPGGVVVELGKKVNTIINVYQAMQEGKGYRNCKPLTKEEISWWEEHGIDWNHVEKATSKNVKLPVQDFLDEFHLTLEEFEQALRKTKKGKQTGAITSGDEAISLKAFCLKGGYSYKLVSRVMKLHEFCQNDTLEQLVNRVMVEALTKHRTPSTWIYELYGTSVPMILQELELDASSILLEMSEKVISLEDAICIHIFRDTCQEAEADYLMDYYEDLIHKINLQLPEQEIIEKVARSIYKIGTKNHLLEEEIQVLNQSLSHSLEKVQEYHILDVGLETNQKRKLEKIEQYHLSEEDIEESYFAPFRFEKGTLLGRKSELYQRRELLRQYIIDWDYYTEEEKEQARLEHSFTEKEVSLIEETRMEINQTLEEVKTKNR